MKVKYFVITVISLLVLLDGYLIVQNLSLKKRVHTLVNTSGGKSDPLNSFLSSRVVADAQLSEPFTFDENVVLTNSLGNRINLDSLARSTSRVLVFRFSPLKHCNSCAEEAMLQLKQFAENEKAMLLFLVTDAEARELYVLEKKYSLEFPFVAIERKFLPAKFEKYDIPYFFTLDSKLEASNFFLVEYELSFLTGTYVSMVRKLFSNETKDVSDSR